MSEYFKSETYQWLFAMCWAIALVGGCCIVAYTPQPLGNIIGGSFGFLFFLLGCYYLYMATKASNRYMKQMEENIREKYAKRKRRGRLSNDEWLEIRTRILKRDNYTCVNCNETGGNLHVHHIVPKSKGGTDEDDNLVTLCDRCHSVQDDEGHHLIIPEEA